MVNAGTRRTGGRVMKTKLFSITFCVSLTTTLLGQVNSYDSYQPSAIINYAPSPKYYDEKPQVQWYYVKGYTEQNAKDNIRKI